MDERDVDALWQELLGVDELLRQLDVSLCRQDVSGTGDGRGSSERPLVYRDGVSEVATEVRDALAVMARAVVAELGIAVPVDGGRVVGVGPYDPASTGERRSSLARLLLDNFDHVVAGGAVGRARLMAACRHARVVIDRRVPRRFMGNCGACGSGLYMRTDWNAEKIACGNCQAQWHVDDLTSALAERASAYLYDKMGTATELAGLMRALGYPLKTTTVHWWARSGKLASVGRGKRQWPLYRYDDVYQLCSAVYAISGESSTNS